ncbi:hypothetical protein [Priestia megaterium]|uniref:hypothetical protein n=1 Tax=Priestia megaterium TaxID=1404 RepID=UPI0028780242|nr:hypothetical protein [Priestia megaterium]
MNADQIKKSSIYETALDCAKNGESIHDTLILLLERSYVKTQVNKGNGEWLVSLALIIEQAYKDVSPIAEDVEYKEF